MSSKIVVKLGGSALQERATVQALSRLIREAHQRKYQVIVVHGGGPSINKALAARGIQWKFINGQRQTTPEMMDVIEEVLGGNINLDLVEELQSHGILATGLSGAREQILICTALNQELIRVGQIQQVHVEVLHRMLKSNSLVTPVIAPLGIGYSGERYNINADWAASQIAIRLKADQLIYLTDQEGILDENKNCLPQIDLQLMNELILSGVIHGGMLVKAQAVRAALLGQVQVVKVMRATESANFFAQPKMGTRIFSDHEALIQKHAAL